MRALMAVSGVYCNVTMNSDEGDISNKARFIKTFLYYFINFTPQFTT